MKGNSMQSTHVSATRIAILGSAAALVAAAALAGCAAASGTPVAATAPSGAATAAAGQDRGGLTGEVVQLGSGYFLAQGNDMQTTVTYDSSTTFTNQIAGSLADVVVGSCVSAFDTPSTDSSGSSASTSTAVTTVTVSQSVDGECTGGFGGGAGFPGGPSASGMPTDGQFPGGDASGFPGGAPTDGGFPGGSATGAPGAGGTFRTAGAVGKVTAVSGDTITVESSIPTAAANGDAASSAPTSSTTTVTVDSSTTYQVEQEADASALAVGLCVTARGTADTSGGYAATSVALSPKGENGCSTTTGRGQFRTGQGASGQRGPGTTTEQNG